MFELTAETAIEYAKSRPELRAVEWRARGLGGGVSNHVVLLESADRRVVIKQALGRLRVAEEWLADRSRVHRECAALRGLAPVLPPGAVPQVVMEDQANFLYAMEAAPAAAADWKTRLLAGDADPETGRRAARILAALIAASWRRPEWAAAFGDQHCFDQLRLDPYYRFTASRHPDLGPHFAACIERCRRGACALVHGDFSPKNLLVAPGGALTLIDFEVIHYGDPGFDAAFLLNHLLLKAAHGVTGARAVALAFWRELRSAEAARAAIAGGLEASTIAHLGCLHLARVDGKSPAEYLGEQDRTRVRAAARQLILHPPDTIEEILQ